MNGQPERDLSRTLVTGVAAAKVDPSPEAVEQAQRALLQRLHASHTASSFTRPPWFAAAAAAMLAIIAFVAVPLLPQSGGAFAAVQQHFRDFKTLSMHVQQLTEGRVMQTSRMVVNAQGVLRTDVGGDLSVVVDPVRGRVLTLLHASRQATVMQLDGQKTSPEAALQWLDKIRSFQGRAERLPGTQVINGQVAHGWSLQINGNPVVLWAGPDGLPLAMQLEQSGQLEITFRFDFDQPIPPGHLSSSVPSGYVLTESEPH